MLEHVVMTAERSVHSLSRASGVRLATNLQVSSCCCLIREKKGIIFSKSWPNTRKRFSCCIALLLFLVHLVFLLFLLHLLHKINFGTRTANWKRTHCCGGLLPYPLDLIHHAPSKAAQASLTRFRGRVAGADDPSSALHQRQFTDLSRASLMGGSGINSPKVESIGRLRAFFFFFHLCEAF